MIWEVVKEFGILKNHIFANDFIYNEDDIIVGYDRKNPTSQTGGKALGVKELNLNGEVIIIGDGMTDHQIKQQGYAQKFYAFTENVSRDPVVKVADKVLKNIEEFLPNNS